MNLYKTLYADPPWPEYGGGKIKRGADRHYKLMKVEDIKALAPMVKVLADPGGCHLYLWTNNNYLPAALEVMKAWGFDFKTMITWAKDRFGIGQYYRGQTEHCLFGTRGTLPYRTLPDGKRAQGRTLITAPKQEHSQKPEEMRATIEKVSHEPRIELFARVRRPGWDVWGFQAPEETTEAPPITTQFTFLEPDEGETCELCGGTNPEYLIDDPEGKDEDVSTYLCKPCAERQGFLDEGSDIKLTRRQPETFRAEPGFVGGGPRPYENPSRPTKGEESPQPGGKP